MLDNRSRLKLDRLIKRFPEVWVHTKETIVVNGITKTFHHVDYRSANEEKTRVRLVSHVSSDMCELLVTLKNLAPDIIEMAAGVKTARAARNRAT
jgi:hypothetical protein